MNIKDNNADTDDRFYGAVTVGERGQIVIPAEARKRYGIETGDKVLVLGTPNGKGLMLVKIDALRAFMNTMMHDLERAEKEIETTLPPEEAAA